MKYKHVKKILDRIDDLAYILGKLGPCDIKADLKQRIKDLEEAQVKYQSEKSGDSHFYEEKI